MSKIEVISDHLDVERQRVVIEMSVPLDFLKAAVSNPDKIKQAFAMGFADAMDEFISKKQEAK